MKTTPIRTLLQPGPLDTNQLVKVSGTVTLTVYSGAAVFLQDETGAIELEGENSPALASGDLVEAVGTLHPSGYSRTLRNCRYHRLGKGPPVRPQPVTGAQLKSGAWDMHLVRAQGRLLRDPILRNDALVLEIKVDETFLSLLVTDSPGSPLAQLRPGSLLEATGACSVGPDDEGRPAWIRIYLHGDDVRVLRGPPWWTPERMSLFSGLIAALALAALGWMAMLRHRGVSRELEQRVRAATADLRDRTTELERVNQELEAFSYSVSHDLRSPLRAMAGLSQALLEDYSVALDDTGKDYLNRISKAAGEMNRLIDGLLALADVNQRELHREQTDVSELVHTVAEEVRQSHPGVNAQVKIQPGMVDSIDRNLARIVFTNLLQNAWKFSRHATDPRVEVGQLPHASAPVYFVRDNGAGFDPAQAERLFQPFQRLHSTSQYEGTGIGLATVRKAVGSHGGRIWAEGKVNQGATFFFTLRSDR